MSSTCSEGGHLALENGFRQKLSSLENSAARITTIKSHLRANSERIKREINNMVSHQLALIRGREQELMQQLDQVVTFKESILNQQQETINQRIGACQQSLETIQQRDGDLVDLKHMLARFGTMDLSPRETSHVALEADFMMMRQCLIHFGRVVATNGAHKTGESLPHEVEEYEDAIPMVHKSVILPQLPNSHSVPSQLQNSPKIPASHTVHNWLTKLPSEQNVIDADVDTLMREYEEMTNRVRLDSFNDSTVASSFELVNGRRASPTGSPVSVLSEPMKEALDQSKTTWLLGKPESDEMKRKVIFEEHPSPKKTQYEFERVIADVRNSDNEQWLLKEVAVQTDFPLAHSMSSTSLATDVQTVVPGVPTNTPYSGTSTPSTSATPPFHVVFPRIFAQADPAVELAKHLQNCRLETKEPSSPFDEAEFLQTLLGIFHPKAEVSSQDKAETRTQLLKEEMKTLEGWMEIIARNQRGLEGKWLLPKSELE
ncbi:unnamed protein product, partial [Mesorhabditis spiculigera]